jgi:hypothetical protein
MRVVKIVAAVLLCNACASTVDGTRRGGMDAAVMPDVPPGRNADGLDPFRPADVLVSADANPDADPWDLRDATLFDQRTATFTVGLVNGDTNPTGYLSATFRLFPRPDDPRCEYTAAASWSIQRCRQDQAAVRDTHPTPFPHGGELRVAGGVRDLVARPGSNGQYATQTSPDAVFRDGAVVTLRAAGSASVPAFSVNVPIPLALAVTSPAEGMDVVIDRSRDFVVTWTPITARLVNVILSFVPPGSPPTSARIDVQAPADTGRAVIPARVLQRVEVPPEGLQGSLSLQPTNLVLSRAGQWPIQVTVVGRGASFPVRLR